MTKPGDRQDVYDALAKPDHPSIHPDGACSRRQMRCCEADELPRCDDFGLLPELRKMLLIAGNEVVSTGFVSAFQEYVVVRVARHFQAVGRHDDMAAVLDELYSCGRTPLRILRCGRASTPAYSSKIGGER